MKGGEKDESLIGSGDIRKWTWNKAVLYLWCIKTKTFETHYHFWWNNLWNSTNEYLQRHSIVKGKYENPQC